MSRRRFPPLFATVVATAAAVVVSPLLAAPLMAPAWAEPLPDGMERTAGSAGSVGSVWVTGAARLDTPATVGVAASVVVPARTQASIVVRLAGRTCRSSTAVPRGRSTVRAACTVTVGASAIPSASAAVTVTLDRVVAGERSRTSRGLTRSVAVDDGAPVAQDEAGRRWRELAAALHAQAGGSAVTAQATSLYSSADLASRVWQQARSSGWSSTATRGLLADLLAGRKADGGYGLAAAWDAYGDGTVNPAATTYTVTTAGHVGWLLLEAAKAGVLPADGLTSAIDALLGMPRLNGGTCFAYSNSAHDRAEPCVYNVSHGAAAFLTQARELTDHRAAEVEAVLGAVRSRLTDGYDPATGYWVYMAGSRTAQDVSHQVYTAKSVDVVDPTFHAVDRMMALPWWRQPGGMSQTPAALGSAMMDVAKDCTYARSPAVLLAAQRALGSRPPAFTLLGMAAVADEIVGSCFS